AGGARAARRGLGGGYSSGARPANGRHRPEYAVADQLGGPRAGRGGPARRHGRGQGRRVPRPDPTARWRLGRAVAHVADRPRLLLLAGHAAPAGVLGDRAVGVPERDHGSERGPGTLRAGEGGMTQVTVVGGGLAGMTAAHALGERGVPVRLVEAAAHPGGIGGAATMDRRAA